MTDEEVKYFYLICKLINGYNPEHKKEVDPNGWTHRKEGLIKVKSWFKYDKNVCNGQAPLVFNEILDDPTLNYVKIAIGELGTKEIAGTESNLEVEKYFAEIGHKNANGKSKHTDATAWCAAFANYVLMKGNPEISRKNALNAVSFSYSGYEEVNEPFYG